LKCLRRADLHACRIRSQVQRDVARDRYVRCRGFCRIGVTGGCDLDCRRGRQVSGRGVHPSGRDRSKGRISARHGVNAPTDGGVSCVRDRGRERRLVPEHDRCVRWRQSDHDCWRRRRWCRHATSSTAKRPCPLRKKCEDHNRRRSGLSSFTMREGAHALPNAGGGPAKK